METDSFEFRQLVADIVEQTTKKVLTDLGLIKPFLSENQAGKIYGASNVRYWIKEGLIKYTQDGGSTSPKRLERSKLDILVRTANRAQYKTVKERKR